MRRIKLLLLFTVVFGIGVSVGAAVSTQKMMLEDEVYLSPTSGTSLKMLLDSRNLGGARSRSEKLPFHRVRTREITLMARPRFFTSSRGSSSTSSMARAICSNRACSVSCARRMK